MALSRQDVVDDIKTFLFAGHDTTASALSWALYLLATHPADEAKLLAELRAAPAACSASALAQVTLIKCN